MKIQKKISIWIWICIIIYIAIIVLSTSAYTEDILEFKGIIEGMVLDDFTNDPIEGVYIETNIGFSTVTRSNGDYLITGHKSGRFTITVHADGYLPEKLTSQINVLELGVTSQNFKLINKNKDYDEDGLPNGWEIYHELNYLDKTGIHGKDGDFDDDCWMNYQEYIMGTNPSDASIKPFNTKPTAPISQYPCDNQEITSQKPTLLIYNANDFDGHKLSYVFKIYNNDGIILEEKNISQGESPYHETSWQVNKELPVNTKYYWRAKSFDGIDYSNWTKPCTFIIKSKNIIPSTPTISWPRNLSEIKKYNPILEINNSFDMTCLDKPYFCVPLLYDFELYEDQNMEILLESQNNTKQGNNGATLWALKKILKENNFYWWRARAKNYEGLTSDWTVLSGFFVNKEDAPPSMPVICSPQNGAEISSLSPLLKINNSIDPDFDELVYFFEIDWINTFNSPTLIKSVGISEYSGQITLWRPSELKNNIFYYWRVRARGDKAYSEWNIGTFFINCSEITIDIELGKGWDMVSLPVFPEDTSIKTLFPDAEAIFKFTTKYILLNKNDKLEIGHGYWICLSNANTYSITGTPINSYTTNTIPSAWSMIGSCSYPAKFSIDNDAIITVFSFLNNYYLVGSDDYLQPGKGYWFNISKQSTLTIKEVYTK